MPTTQTLVQRRRKLALSPCHASYQQVKQVTTHTRDPPSNTSTICPSTIDILEVHIRLIRHRYNKTPRASHEESRLSNAERATGRRCQRRHSRRLRLTVNQETNLAIAPIPTPSTLPSVAPKQRPPATRLTRGRVEDCKCSM